MKEEKNHIFVESSLFADKIKWQKGFSFGNKWHYINTPYMPKGQEPRYKIKSRPMNITKVTTDLIDWLRKTPKYQNSKTYQTIMKKFRKVEEGESFALRMLIHLVGDLHQPCHAFTLFSARFPRGDRGCNGIKLKSRKKAKSLHAVWDKSIY